MLVPHIFSFRFSPNLLRKLYASKLYGLFVFKLRSVEMLDYSLRALSCSRRLDLRGAGLGTMGYICSYS